MSARIKSLPEYLRGKKSAGLLYDCLAHGYRFPHGIFSREILAETNWCGGTPVHIAAEYGALARIPREFLDELATPQRDLNGRTPLHVGAQHAFDKIPVHLICSVNLALEDAQCRTVLPLPWRMASLTRYQMSTSQQRLC